jgi:hypothetical protein
MTMAHAALGLQTHLEYKVLIAFPLQQWLHRNASMFLYELNTLPVLMNSAGCAGVQREFFKK